MSDQVRDALEKKLWAIWDHDTEPHNAADVLAPRVERFGWACAQRMAELCGERGRGLSIPELNKCVAAGIAALQEETT